MVGWHHQLNGHEFEQTPGDSRWMDGKLKIIVQEKFPDYSEVVWLSDFSP